MNYTKRAKNEIVKNPMADMPVNRLLLTMGFPMIISMMLQAVYNIVDSAFVSNMPEQGEMALNALTLAFPVQVLMIAVGIGTGVGVNVLLSKSLGQGDRERASRAVGNGFSLMLFVYGIFLLFGIFGAETYLRTQTQNREIIHMAKEYLRICCVFSFGSLLFGLYEKALQATGRSLYSTIAQIAGAVVNIVLDPIMIYGWFGLPAMGVAGAAYATVLGQIVSFLTAWIFHRKYNREIKNAPAYMRLSGTIVKSIYMIGFPAIVAQALMSIMTYLLNILFVQIGENVVTAYGLYYKIQQFILFAAFGLRDAITPIISFNHGRKSRERVVEGIRYGLFYTGFMMALGCLGLELLAVPLAGVFGLSGETASLCVSAIRIIALSYVFAGINIALQGIYQALDGGLESLVISLCRQLIFVIPLAYGLVHFVLQGKMDAYMVWYTFPIAEGLTVVVGVGLLLRMYRCVVKKM